MAAPASRLQLMPEDQRCEATGGTTLRDALALIDLQVNAPCGGEGTCGKCRVYASGDIDPVTDAERAQLATDLLSQGLRLSCQARMRGDVEVSVPAQSRAAEMRILPGGAMRDVPLDPAIRKQRIQMQPQGLAEPYSRMEQLRRCGDLRADLEADVGLLTRLPVLLGEMDGIHTAVVRGQELLDLEPADTTDRCFGVALDLGTTTVVASLMDLSSGKRLAQATAVNEQAAHGHDVIARINMTIEEEDGLGLLRQAAIASLRAVVEEAADKAGVRAEEIYEATLVGNATMVHLCLGIPPASLGLLPYVAITGDAMPVEAEKLDLPLHPRARACVLPSIGGYIGADTIGALLACNLDEDDGQNRLVVDIGTNCELVLRTGEHLIAASTPAGPAFEGARISCGMYAVSGAIEKVHLDDDVQLGVIGKTAPRGLCGSALVDLGAELLRVGIVDDTGRMLPTEEMSERTPPALQNRVVIDDEGLAFVLSEASNGSPRVALSQHDIRELQLAKGAIRTGIDLVLEHAGLAVDQLDELCLAGGFGNYLDSANAMSLGLIPHLPAEKVRFVGNAALVGAQLALLSQPLRQRATQVARQVEHLQIAGTPDFQIRFTESMLFAVPQQEE